MERYPQIAGFHFVSSLVGTGIQELEKELLRVTLEQKNMGEKVPKVWLNMEKKILAARAQTSILPWKVIKDFGMEVGIYDEKDIREAIQFLHELGTVQYFDNDFLRQQVVINPQWIVNVMSCVVSVKNSPIQDHHGRFLHRYIPDIWCSYPEELHQWLLQLTEEFDLTFPLPKENVNIVPCLLPQEVPSELDWPVLDDMKVVRETKMVYKFTYLPAGLFNRAQVRLFQFSDGKFIWKRGSLLNKNKHLALIQQTSDSELLVKVQGPRPENVVLLIHEIFESLIQESFHGVIYDFLLPCPDCIMKEGTLEPSLFEGSLVRRAREHRAPFLQCRKYFHTISMAQLFEIMPTDSASDFDAHLQSSLAIMQQLSQGLSTDCAVIYSSLDVADDNDSVRINPAWVKRDLEKAGLSCWFSDDMDNTLVEDVMMALKNCKIVVALVSDNFESDDKSHDLLLYTMDTLSKNYIIVVVGDSLAWQNTDLGMRIGKQESMVMIKNKSRYSSRVEEMVTGVKAKLGSIHSQVQQHPSVFISYCWTNSQHAKSRGTNCPPEALGWGDPREIKEKLEERGLTCWLDFDQPAAGKGLFKNITEGIRNSKVMVACVSDEYVKSDNCMMELRFGVLNMGLPTVICVVGTGKEWEYSEVGILMHRAKAAKVFFQEENPEAMDVLEKFIRERLPENSDQLIQKQTAEIAMRTLQEQQKDPKKKKKNTNSANVAIKEEYELMQRKFMRHIISYVSSMDVVPAPRLIIIDFEKVAKGVVKKSSQNDMDSSESHSKHSSLRPTLRPKTASRSSRLINVVLDEEEEKWEGEPFCLKVMCEHEEGWHICKTSMPLKMNEELKGHLKGCSPYMARMFAILRQSAVSLNCFEGPIGQKFTQWIEQNALEHVNFLESYGALRNKLVEDSETESGSVVCQLHRCHLPTGKIYWLCDKHSNGPRIAKLSTESASSSEVGRVLYEEDTKMRDNLEQSETYKQKKSGSRPVNKVELPPLDFSVPETSANDVDDKILMAALAANKAAAENNKETKRQTSEPANEKDNKETNQQLLEPAPSGQANQGKRLSVHNRNSAKGSPSPSPSPQTSGSQAGGTTPTGSASSKAKRTSMKGAASAVSATSKNNTSKTCVLQ
ncbi:uncharacterized protein LOC106011403 [Aplysia californica]|uniref:Uncharacterized protein LOC106011403 n=1 Tax=Aplysia californica TaxID=6500 RepID=A0ABM0ZX82_APLCA|nr:uncharacterized protein LOC106011403 [Aplysia californica]